MNDAETSGTVSRAVNGGWECSDGADVAFAQPGPAYRDDCDVCNADPSDVRVVFSRCLVLSSSELRVRLQDCTLDCLGVFGGSAVLHDCVLADGSPFTLCGADCTTAGGYDASTVAPMDDCE